ncbi:MAG TPA: single-stranded-DNA-specific exonuclease RecJ [Syntrophomonas sp.]|nr:single-stranded-DNA-specific exonuclease RecJ [Syntrophomonas sp.]
MQNIWQLKPYDHEPAAVISGKLGLSQPVARLLAQRGCRTPQQAERFMHPRLDLLEDPFRMQGMRAAAERIAEAIAAGERIVIYGDYDVDGVCSIVILKECFGKLGYEVDYYVPNRFSEGYGLNEEALRALRDQGYKLIITVDCGIAALTEAELAKALGLDLIITDHHTPAEQQPEACAVIDPKLDQLTSVFHLAGAGVSYKLACALLQAAGMDVGQEWLDLVALATVADIVPLIEENRILVKYGLQALEHTQRPGLTALMELTGLRGKTLTSWHIGFVLAPRLNSAGRLDSARKSIALLLSRDEREAGGLAEELCRLNEERREIEEQIYRQALLDLPDLEQQKFVIAGGENWHEGVIGIVASRLASKLNRPAIVISWEGEQGKGSARSSGEFDLYEALRHCSRYLDRFGGHRMAAGLALHRDQLENFRQALQDYMQGQELPPPEQKIYPADLEVNEDELDLKLVREIEMLAPFGEGNPVPKLVLRGSPLHDMLLVGANDAHLKFKAGMNRLEAIAFNGADMMHPGQIVCKQDLLFDLSENNFRGRSSLQLVIRDMKPAWRDDLDPTEFALAKQVLKTAVADLIKGHPVLFVYPGLRGLQKHRAMLGSLVKADMLQEMHGGLDKRNREVVLGQFNRGDRKIYLTTRAFIAWLEEMENRGNLRVTIPPDLKTVVNFWMENDTDNGLLAGHNPDIFNLASGFRISSSPTNNAGAGPGRSIIYANRPATVKDLVKRYPDAHIEAGSSDAEQRRDSRRQFRNCRDGLLLVDGSHPSGPGRLGWIDRFTLQDSPFAYYELAAVADYIDNDELPLNLAFAATDLERNFQHLQRIYPEPRRLELIWQALLDRGGSSLRIDTKELALRIGKATGSAADSLEMTSVLHILSDLGLCQFQKSGSIMAIYFHSTQKDALQPEFSPYFREGESEKALLQDWRAFCEKYTGMVM